MMKSSDKEDKQFYETLKKLLSFPPNDIKYYRRAFTHRSLRLQDEHGDPINYERLEFLGDAMLGAVIAAYLYKEAPRGNEGYLTQMRSKIVSRKHLNELGKDLDLLRFVKSKISNENRGDNIYGNIFEALIGAIYLDKGFEYCNKFIYQKVIDPYVDIEQLEGKVTSYKGLMIEWCQKQKKKYSLESYEDTGNEQVKHFSVKVFIDGALIAKARSTSKKKAEEKASKRAYFVLQDQVEQL